MTRFLRTLSVLCFPILFLPPTLLAVPPANINSPITHDSVLHIQPEELWRVGVDDDERGGPLGHIVDAVVDQDGSAYLLDESLVVVKKYDARGNFIQDLGRRGEGPGEFNIPLRLNLFPDGNLGVFQLLPSRIILLDSEGVPQGLFNAPSDDIMRHHFHRARSSRDITVLSRSYSTIAGKTMTSANSLQIYDAVGNPVASAIEEQRETLSQGMSINDGTEMNGLAECWDLSQTNRIYVAPHFNRYEILIFDGAGTAVGTIRTQYESVRRSREQLAELERGNDSLKQAEGRSVDINPYLRDISGLYCRPDSSLWVLTSQGEKDCPDNQLGIFHVYDETGNYSHNLVLSVDYDPLRDDFRLDGSTLFILKEAKMMPATTSTASFGNFMVARKSVAPKEETLSKGEAKPFSVICYRVPR